MKAIMNKEHRTCLPTRQVLNNEDKTVNQLPSLFDIRRSLFEILKALKNE